MAEIALRKELKQIDAALELQPNDKTCLVARSKCYLKLGDPQKALQDAEDALTEDKEFNKGLYRKAEALYCMGDFEYALMYYHRGHKLRPELDEFRLGIQKAQEAIDNSIGSAAKIKLENKGDLSFFTKQDDIGNKKRAGYLKPTTTKKLKPLANRNKEVKPLAPSKKTVKQLLGELYSDKEYFEKLMEDEAFIKSRGNNPIYELVQGGLNYLETRTEFWRQQKPLYARKKEKAKYNVVRKKAKPSISKYVLKQLEEIDQALSSGDPDRSLRLAQKLLKSVEGMNKEDLPTKPEVVANIHSCIGNAYIELDQLTKALRHHDKDLQLSRQSKLLDGESRALDNVGRVHARMGNFKKAVDSWNLKLPLVKASLESTWLCHEIGRCHLELGNNQSAKEFGRKSLSAGKDCEDLVWQLNATVLIAQSEVKLGEVDDAIETFSNALELAIGLGDSSAQAAISKALSELQRRSSQSRRSQGSQGRTSQASEQYLSQSEDEGSPRLKSDMDKHSDGDVTPPGSGSSERSNVVEGGDDEEERTGDEIESDAIFESNQDKEDNTDNGQVDSSSDPDNKVPDGEHDVTPRDGSDDDVTPRNEDDVEESLLDESARDESEAGVPKSGSDGETGAGENEGDVAPKPEGDGEESAGNEGEVEENSRDESEATENIGENEEDVVAKPEGDGNASAGNEGEVEESKTDENEGDGPVAQVSSDHTKDDTHISTNAVLTYDDLDRQSSAEELSVNPSYSETVEDTVSPEASAANVNLVTESIDNVATPDVSAELLTSPIPSTVSDVVPDDSTDDVGTLTEATTSTENVTVTTENVTSEVSLPDTTTAEDTTSHVEDVSTLNETTDNASPSIKDETPVSEATNAEELPLDTTTSDITSPEDTPRETSIVETTSGNDSTQAEESSSEEIPPDSSEATLVSTTDEIPRDVSDASLSASEEISQDVSEGANATELINQALQQTTTTGEEETTTTQEASSVLDTGDEAFNAFHHM